MPEAPLTRSDHAPLSNRRPSEGAFSLLELLVALSILAVVGAIATSSFRTQLRSNYDAELRFEGTQAAQAVIDTLRYENVELMPGSGEDAARPITVQSGRVYDVYVAYCVEDDLCTSNGVRHLALRAEHRGTVVFETETVFTALETSYSASSDTSGSSSSAGSSATSVSSSSSAASSFSSSSSSSSFSSSSSSSSRSSSRSSRCRHWWC